MARGGKARGEPKSQGMEIVPVDFQQRSRLRTRTAASAGRSGPAGHRGSVRQETLVTGPVSDCVGRGTRQAEEDCVIG